MVEFRFKPVDRATTMLALALACLFSPTAWADRPFLATTTAVAEEDDDNVWSVSSWLQKQRSLQAFALSAEYAFNPTNAIEVSAGRARLKGSSIRTTDAEIEYKHLFNKIGRDDWAVGIAVAYQREREQAGAFKDNRSSLGVRVPFSWAVVPGSLTLHANVGVEKPKGESREFQVAVGAEYELRKNLNLFAEFARQSEVSLAHGGVRWWVKREKWAIDAGVLQTKADGSRSTGFVIGVSAYDW